MTITTTITDDGRRRRVVRAANHALNGAEVRVPFVRGQRIVTR